MPSAKALQTGEFCPTCGEDTPAKNDRLKECQWILTFMLFFLNLLNPLNNPYHLARLMGNHLVVFMKSSFLDVAIFA